MNKHRNEFLQQAQRRSSSKRSAAHDGHGFLQQAQRSPSTGTTPRAQPHPQAQPRTGQEFPASAAQLRTRTDSSSKRSAAQDRNGFLQQAQRSPSTGTTPRAQPPPQAQPQ